MLVAAADAVDAGPQPGDVDDTKPIVDKRAPILVDAGPVDGGPSDPDEAAAQPVDVTAQEDTDASAAGHVPAERASPTSDPDEAGAHPVSAPSSVDATTPRVDEPTPTVDPASRRADEAGEAGEGDGASADVVTPAEAPLPEGFGFGGVPAINYDADNGFGFGVVATLFSYDGKTKPYRLAVTLQLFMTSKLVQDHNVVVDWLDVADLPLRLWTRVGYLQSLTQNYCGLGGDVVCDPEEARRAAASFGAGTREELEQFERRYYLRRFINPYGIIQARWALAKRPLRFELTGGYRAMYFIPGSWDDEDEDGAPDTFPYPGSLYARDFPDGEPGFASVVQAGFMVDTRDNEPAPTEGVWLEASARTAGPYTGSTWTWSGANLTMRGYAPLTSDHKLVLANRLVFDTVIGNPPIQELARAGGTFDFYLYGGSEAGRGIRVQRYLGKLRVFDQTEVRWRFFDAELLGQKFGFTGAGFVDLGLVGRELADPGPMPLLPGFGGALRLSWNENFIIRFDVGFSPLENYAPSPYLLIGNPF